MTTARKLARSKWLQVRVKDAKGNYTPAWKDFKKKYLKEDVRGVKGQEEAK